MGNEEENQKKKKSSTLDKIFLGVVVGGAVGSVVGATVSNKEIRDKVRKKISETGATVKEIVGEKGKSKKGEKKVSFWHILNWLFCRKKKEKKD